MMQEKGIIIDMAGLSSPIMGSDQEMTNNPIMMSSIKSNKSVSSVISNKGIHQVVVDEHLIEIPDLCTRYGTGFDVNSESPLKNIGLSTKQIEEYHLSYPGRNELSPPKKPSPIKHFFGCLFTDVFNVLLMTAGVMSLLLFFTDMSVYDNLYLGIILFVVSFSNASLQFLQEHRTAALLSSFMKMIPQSSLVLRDSHLITIPSIELIPGDLVVVKSGDKVPADIRLVHCSELKVDNSSLTGESEPQDRSIPVTMVENPLEASNLIFNGTMVVSGEGLGIVIRTGDTTFLGQIATLTMQGERRPSQLTREIDIFVKKLAVIAIGTAVLFFLFGSLQASVSFGMNFSFAVGVFASFVPEGLPLTVTALLTISAKKMAKLNVLVKDLHSVETLGAITLLATDKTGTLTQNKMAVSDVWMNSQFYHHGTNDELSPKSTPNLNHLIEICALCTRVKATTNFLEVQSEQLKYPNNEDKEIKLDVESGIKVPNISSGIRGSSISLPKLGNFQEVKIHGDATEVGIYKFSMFYGVDPVGLALKHPIVFEIPFSSQSKWHLTVHRYLHTNGHFMAFLKGAPERVAAKCKKIFYSSPLDKEMTNTIEWSPNIQSDFDSAYTSLASQGRRVLAFASMALPETIYGLDYIFTKQDFSYLMPEYKIKSDQMMDNQVPTPNLASNPLNFAFVGLLAMMDPPKHGVKRAINALRMAGVQVVMVTGDHPLTAEAIARNVGILQGTSLSIGPDHIITGQMIKNGGDYHHNYSHNVPSNVCSSTDKINDQINCSSEVAGSHQRIETCTDAGISFLPENGPDGIIIHGDVIDSLTDAEWDMILSCREVVFARTSPKHKLEIVTRCQAKGHIVGVSGDGVNDSPALKKADLGISMNVSASDVSKEAAAMILLDDNFCSIVHGIEQGRLLFANLKKSIRYTLTHSLPEIMAFLLFIIMQIPLPINTLLLLTIDLATELAPSMSLAWEEPESELMLVPPRKVLCTSSMTCSQYDALTGNPRLAQQSLSVTGIGGVSPGMGYLNQRGPSEQIVFSPSWKDATSTMKGCAFLGQYQSGKEVFLNRFGHEVFQRNYFQGKYGRPYSTVSFHPLSPANRRPLKEVFSEPGLNGDIGAMQTPSSIHPLITTVGEPLQTITLNSKTSSIIIKNTKFVWFWQAWGKCYQWYKRNFTREETGEVLVDTDLILWAYLEGGVFVTIGCFLAYFFQFYLENVPLSLLWQSASIYFKQDSPTLTLTNNLIIDGNQQIDILLSVQSAYYMAIVIGQIFTLFMVKKIYDYPFGRDAFKNRLSLIAIGITLSILFIILYVPFMHILVPAGPVYALTFVMPISVGVLMIIYEFTRRFFRKRGYFGGVPAHTDDHLQVVLTATASIFEPIR